MPSAVPRHRGPGLLADSLGRPQGFSRTTNPLSFPGVATRPDPLLSWASFPFRVLPSRSACRRNARPGPARTRTRPSLVRPRLADLARILRDIGRMFIFEHRTRLLRPCARLYVSDRYRRSDLPWAFLLHPPVRERSRGHASRPFEDHTLRLVALLLYFGFPNTDSLR